MDEWYVSYIAWARPYILVEFGPLQLFFSLHKTGREFSCLLVRTEWAVDRDALTLSNELMADILPEVLTVMGIQLNAWHENRPGQDITSTDRAGIYQNEARRRQGGQGISPDVKATLVRRMMKHMRDANRDFVNRGKKA